MCLILTKLYNNKSKNIIVSEVKLFILLGLAEAHSVNLKKINQLSTIFQHFSNFCTSTVMTKDSNLCHIKIRLFYTTPQKKRKLNFLLSIVSQLQEFQPTIIFQQDGVKLLLSDSCLITIFLDDGLVRMVHSSVHQGHQIWSHLTFSFGWDKRPSLHKPHYKSPDVHHTIKDAIYTTTWNILVHTCTKIK